MCKETDLITDIKNCDNINRQQFFSIEEIKGFS